MTREERLKEVYEYIRSNFPIHTQADFADSIRYNRAYISSAMNGNERYLTDKLFRSICEVYPDIFNLDYLLNGNGSLLAIKEEVKSEEKGGIDYLINEYSRIIAHVADLRHELLVELTEVKKERQQLQDTLTLLHRHLSYMAPASEIEATTATTMAAEPSPKTREK